MRSAPKVNHFYDSMQGVSAVYFAKIHKGFLRHLAYKN